MGGNQACYRNAAGVASDEECSKRGPDRVPAGGDPAGRHVLGLISSAGLGIARSTR